MVGDVHDVITCAKFQIEIFMGYDFTGGRIFDFPIDLSMGLTTVQRYCAACDLSLFLRAKMWHISRIHDQPQRLRKHLRSCGVLLMTACSLPACQTCQ